MNATSHGVRDGDLGRRVRRYYRTVSRFIDRERVDRPDGSFWCGIARDHADGLALDLGCGTGRVTRLLAAELRWVLGVDLSPEMLALARRRCLGARVRLLAADMRGLTVDARFDLVTAANDPFAHLVAGEDRDRALRAVARHLAPGARFVLDAHWFPPRRLARAISAAGLVVERPGEGIFVRETWRCRPDGACHARYEYLRGDERLAEAEFDSRYWTEGEVRERLARAGLAPTALWGDYDRSPWHPESARRLVVEARPAAPRGQSRRRVPADAVEGGSEGD